MIKEGRIKGSIPLQPKNVDEMLLEIVAAVSVLAEDVGHLYLANKITDVFDYYLAHKAGVENDLPKM